MSSLSYNWQNEFSDLRYQVDQLQKTDPAKYSALGASLGLKAGQQIQVPSQYSPQWASQFVMAAGLYTPPPPSAATFNPASATPTAVVATTTGPLTPTGISISGLMISTTATATATASGSSAEITNDTHSSGGSHHSGDAEATAGLDTQNTSSQFGNPIAGNLNTDDTPIIPSGIGYNTGYGLTFSWRLEFGRQFYSADDIIKVLAALPSLVHLSCGIRELQAEILAIPVSERPSGLRQKYYLLSKNFRTLSVAYPKDGVLTEDVAYAAMLIAVLCPNFAQVNLPTEQRRNFGCEIAKIYVDCAFKPYADAVRRLIYLEKDQ
ncbi:hypothetical protein H4S02_005510 [Coemansia sp. RSA 2611]|nr:hypothetical protein H4S02_005510 [Coemansia sp. RSA 2611]